MPHLRIQPQDLRPGRKLRAASPVERATRSGFTLTEVLITVGIIVLVVTLAVPAFNVISGNRSVDAAQNQLSAVIGRARQEALGMQDFRGVILFQDSNTGRVAAAEVYYPDPSGSPGIIELAPTHDELLLPNGVSALLIQDGGTYAPMGVFMFNGQGQLVSLRWALNTGSGTVGANLIKRVQPFPTTGAPDYNLTTPTNDSSDYGFLLLPTDGFRIALAVNQTMNATMQQYVTDNGLGFLINRYNGTLLRTE